MSSWLGPDIVRPLFYRNVLPPAPEPPVFSPLDITDCVLWLDANDSSTVEVNEDTSGVNLNRVMKWFDKAQPSNQNYYSHVGNPAGSGLYNVHTMNQLNTIYFEQNAFMDHQDNGVTFNFQARTFFSVIKPLTVLDNTTPYLGIYNTDTFPGGGVGYMNTLLSWNDASGTVTCSMCENGQSCGIQFDISGDIVNQRMILMFAQTDQIDLSGNAGVFDTLYKPLISSDPADTYATGQSQYILNNPNYDTAQDIAEIIMYGRLLTTDEQRQVLDYLVDKWNLSGPNLNYSVPGNLEVVVPEPPLEEVV